MGWILRGGGGGLSFAMLRHRYSYRRRSVGFLGRVLLAVMVRVRNVWRGLVWGLEEYSVDGEEENSTRRCKDRSGWGG